MEKEKAFYNFRHNGFHFHFPNGNMMSVTWAVGTYTENGDMASGNYKSFLKNYKEFLQSDDVEIMFDAPKALTTRIEKRYNDGHEQPLSRINMVDFIKIFNTLSK